RVRHPRRYRRRTTPHHHLPGVHLGRSGDTPASHPPLKRSWHHRGRPSHVGGRPLELRLSTGAIALTSFFAGDRFATVGNLESVHPRGGGELTPRPGVAGRALGR